MNIWDILLRITQFIFAFLGLFGLYNLLVTLPIFLRYKTPTGPNEPLHRFAVVISARNEAKVIGNLIASLRKMTYPQAYFEIFVIADNCTDETAAIARGMGCHVYERFDTAHQSKGYALNWFFNRFFAEHKGEFDSCCVIDADNVVSADFLTHMNQQRNRGERVIVGYRIGKNPTSGVLAGCNSLFWLLQRRGHDHPRAIANRSLLSVGGTGFVFDLSLIEESGWNTRSITEDLEFAMDMVLRGQKIAYCTSAVIYDEQPTTIKATYKQRCRWTLGTLQMMQMKAIPLLKSVLGGQLKAFDGLMYSLGYPFLILMPITWVLTLFFELMRTGDFLQLARVLAVSAMSGQVILSTLIFLIAKAEKQVWPGQWKAILVFPIYTIMTTMVGFRALFDHSYSWEPIEHNDQTAIEDLEKVKVLGQNLEER